MTATVQPRPVVRHKSKQSRSQLFAKIFLILAVILFAAPLYIAFVNIFKTTDTIQMYPLALPTPPTIENLKSALVDPNANLFLMYFNSVVITAFGSTICILVSSMAAFYTARAKTRIAKFLYVYFIFGLMVPYCIVYLPLVIIFKGIGLIGNLAGLIPVFVSGSISISVFIYHGFMKSVPAELEESAAIDGAGQFRIFAQIIFPLLRPCTATIAVIIGLSMWNDFVTPLLIGHVQTITVGIYTAIGQFSSNWGHLFAFVFYGAFPVMILYLLAQKHIIAGLTAGAIKG